MPKDFLPSALRARLRWPNFTADYGATQSTEGKFGIPRFNWGPARLMEYMYRVRARSAKEQTMADNEVKKLGLVEGLSGSALRIAQTLEMEDLAKPGGAETLLAKLEKELKPKRVQQARQLYAAGAAQHGVLSRQHGEPMATYVLRRRTCYRCLLDA